MPEGHTLHRLAAQIGRLFTGQQWRVTSPQGRFDAGAAILTGREPQRAEAWGKHLFVHVGADILHVHLGLYGAFSFRGDESFAGAATLGAPRAAAEAWDPSYDDAGWIVPTPPAGAVRARFHVPNGWADLRGPAKCAVLNTIDYEKVIRRLGPDPLRQTDASGDAGRGAAVLSTAAAPSIAVLDGAGFDEAMLQKFASNLARRRIGIGAALMDQAAIAGVGNIYRAESLFLEQLSPDTAANELDGDQVRGLWGRLTAQLRDGVEEGLIRTLRPADAPRNDRHRRFWVYQHQGTPCLRCGETIAMRELQGRRLYWCPGCQLR